MNIKSASNIFRRYFYNRLFGKPFYVAIEVTDACNADCDFCGFRRSNIDKVRIRARDSYLDILLELNPIAVGFVGGEPFIRKDLEKLILEAKRDANIPFVQATTNGSFLTIERYKSLSEAGLDRINVSLDFSTEQHDNVRGIK